MADMSLPVANIGTIMHILFRSVHGPQLMEPLAILQHHSSGLGHAPCMKARLVGHFVMAAEPLPVLWRHGSTVSKSSLICAQFYVTILWPGVLVKFENGMNPPIQYGRPVTSCRRSKKYMVSRACIYSA
jgi:hypothetical protein